MPQLTNRPSIADLARAAGVSAATVDRVLNSRHPVRPATAQRVYEAATAIGFHAAPLIRARMAPDVPEFTLGILLQKPEQAFYQDFRRALEAAAQAVTTARLRLIIDFLPNQNPGEIVEKLISAGTRAQAVAVTSIDHPRITEAVAQLRAKGVPVFSLLSDFAQGIRHGYVGVNNLRVGRTAAWMIARNLPAAAEIGLFVGGHRWHGHELRETGFRSFFREAAPQARVLDAMVNLDTPELAYEATLDLMARRPALAGIYCAGGGMEGTIKAIREEGMGRAIALVVNELTEESRLALADGIASLVIATPIRRLAAELMAMMRAAIKDGPAETPGQVFLPMDLHLPESL